MNSVLLALFGFLVFFLGFRFYDVGIAEGHGVTFAAGLAAEGMRPICAIYSTFLQHEDHRIPLDLLP